MPSCDLGERIGVGAGDRPGRRPEAVIVSAVLEVFREGDQASAASGGLVGESDGRGDVASTSSRASSWTRATSRCMAASYGLDASGRGRDPRRGPYDARRGALVVAP